MSLRFHVPIEIQGRLFTRKSQVATHIKESIQKKYSNGQKLDALDEGFMRVIYGYHEHPDIVFPRGITAISVQYLDSQGVQRRFLVHSPGDPPRDVGWRNCLWPRTSDRHVKCICRHLIEQQILEFKDALADYRCQIEACQKNAPDGEVDHAAPHTFNALVARWLKSIGLTASEIEIIPSPKYQQKSRFEDVFLAENWIEFHKEQAVLRWTCHNCNSSVLTRKVNNASN